MKSAKYTIKEITELLESDDELPDSYDDIPDIPKYQNDTRFEIIQFPWVDQKLYNRKSKATQENIIIQTEAKEEEYEESEISKNEKKILLSKGFLSKRDIFIVKSIEEYSTEETLLWLIDFLKSKSVQPSFVTSCLVGDISGEHFNAVNEQLSNFNNRYYLKLVVK